MTDFHLSLSPQSLLAPSSSTHFRFSYVVRGKNYTGAKWAVLSWTGFKSHKGHRIAKDFRPMNTKLKEEAEQDEKFKNAFFHLQLDGEALTFQQSQKR